MTPVRIKRSRTWRQLALIGVGSLAAAAIVSWFLNSGHAKEQSLRAVQAHPPRLGEVPPHDEQGDAPYSARVSSTAAVTLAGSVETGGPPPPEEPPPSDYVGRARAEPRDDAWADPMERLVEDDLEAKAQQLDFRVNSVECRTNTCVAEIVWPTLREARSDFKAALGSPDRSRCQPRLILNEAGHEDAAEMGVLLFHCKTERQRAARKAGAPPDDDDDDDDDDDAM